MSARVSRLIPTRVEATPLSTTTVVARLVALTAEGPLILLPDAQAPHTARSIVPRESLRGREGSELLISFVEQQRDAPVVVGVVQDFREAGEHSAAATLHGVASVQGSRVLIEGAEEIQLQCGQSSLVLRANGEVILRGKRVETRARRQHRIRAGSVRIN